MNAAEITQNIVTQLRLLDPTASAEIGTPERKIIEAVAEQIAQAQVDLSVLNEKHDIDAMTGGRLDAYLGNFGFGRQQSTAATGAVTFSRTSAATEAITIPAGTQLRAVVDSSALPDVVFVTTSTVVLAIGQKEVDAPAQSSTPGSISNVPARAIVGFAGLRSIAGISSVTNREPMVGGVDGENDEALKVRFKNTLFRNMAGTYDQFLALAVSQPSVTKANVVGPISRYQEYVQVPTVDDVAQATRTVSADGVTYAGGGYDSSGTRLIHKRTTASSFIPYSKHIFPQQFYLTDGVLDPATSRFYQPFVDFIFNSPPVATPQTFVASVAYSLNQIVVPTVGNAHQYRVSVAGTAGAEPAWPTGAGSTVVSGAVTFTEIGAPTAQAFDLTAAGANKPNITFLGTEFSSAAPTTYNSATTYTAGQVVTPTSANGHKYVVVTPNGAAGTQPSWPTVEGATVTSGGGTVFRENTAMPGGLKGGDVLLFEHAYMSKNSRNDYALGILNCVDIFVNGESAEYVTSTEAVPTTANALQNTAANLWTYQQTSIPRTINFRRSVDGRMSKEGNWLQPLYWQPSLDVPNEINIGAYTFFRGNYYNDGTGVVTTGTTGMYYNQRSGDGTPGSPYVFSYPAHYCHAIEVNSLHGTVRSRNGIEWFRTGNSLNYLNGMIQGDNPAISYNGKKIDDNTLLGQQFTVADYSYDLNVSATQALMEENKQVTTDVLVHRAKRRYFKPYVTIMYASGVSHAVVDASITEALRAFFNNMYYGAAIQLSDILQVIHNVPGVDNVRWTSDSYSSYSWRTNMSLAVGDVVRPSVGETGLVYQVTVSDGAAGTTEPTWPTPIGSTVSLDGITYKAIGIRFKVEQVTSDGSTFEEGATYYYNDFYIEDSELAAAPDTNGVSITRRAQNTWGG